MLAQGLTCTGLRRSSDMAIDVWGGARRIHICCRRNFTRREHSATRGWLHSSRKLISPGSFDLARAAAIEFAAAFRRRPSLVRSARELTWGRQGKLCSRTNLLRNRGREGVAPDFARPLLANARHGWSLSRRYRILRNASSAGIETGRAGRSRPQDQRPPSAKPRTADSMVGRNRKTTLRARFLALLGRTGLF
ncbi:hypothetical protein ACVWY3_004587 [Bradyrhizobium sp. USDA 4486]